MHQNSGSDLENNNASKQWVRFREQQYIKTVGQIYGTTMHQDSGSDLQNYNASKQWVRFLQCIKTVGQIYRKFYNASKQCSEAHCHISTTKPKSVV